MSRGPASPLPYAIASRILELRRPNERDAEFSRRIGLTPQIISNYRNRVNGASLEAVVTVCKMTGVDANWLLTGEGSHMRIRGERAQVVSRIVAARELIERALDELRLEDFPSSVPKEDVEKERNSED